MPIIPAAQIAAEQLHADLVDFDDRGKFDRQCILIPDAECRQLVVGEPVGPHLRVAPVLVGGRSIEPSLRYLGTSDVRKLDEGRGRRVLNAGKQVVEVAERAPGVVRAMQLGYTTTEQHTDQSAQVRARLG